jgi:hypothetical protein
MANTVEQIINQFKNQKDVFYKAKLLLELKREKGLAIKKISERTGMKPSYICHFIRLNRLPDIVIDGYYSKSISVSHLFILSRLKDPEQTNEAYEKILRNNFSVWDTEMMVRQYLYGINSVGKYLPLKNLEKINQQLAAINQKINLKIIQSRIRGKLVVEIKDSLEKTTPILNELLTKVKEVLLRNERGVNESAP